MLWGNKHSFFSAVLPLRNIGFSSRNGPGASSSLSIRSVVFSVFLLAVYLTLWSSPLVMSFVGIFSWFCGSASRGSDQTIRDYRQLS